ncbi:MAG: thc operon regulatory protein [Mycobacterium sp.]|nr:thc operon regulatory protein [Mycobacterium sp.]
MGGITYETDVAPGFDEHRASYHVRVPLQGWPEPSHRGLELTSTPALASIYRPDSPMTASRWPGGSRHLAIKIDQFAIDRALKTLVDTQIDPPIPFTAALPLNVCAARTWVQLQEGCQPHLGMSPMTYLRSVRLRRARPDLRLADPSNGGVASSAHRWGFTHLGRFGTAHKTEYGETPLEALRAAQ